MSETRDDGRGWDLYVRDMIEFAEKVLSYTDGLDRKAFVADGLTYDATLRNIQLIGEAATNIPAEVRESYPEIPWRAVVGVRNRLAHSYLHISDVIVWSIIQDAIPSMLPQLHAILEDSRRESP
ncbi:MAG: DUF86 domain-containing protein [Chloroflexota bacterium]|nr:DUF86 domain-containing protein [Chloroflexota bacterium]MDE2919385.1 DUF86 domain-containing protein [Chloroflexota bacterium]